MDRDGRICVWCRGDVVTAQVRATTEHLIPRIKGGPSWTENEVVACGRCNRNRGHVSPAEWLDQCELLGMSPNRPLVLARLESLQRRIERDGGQWRARPYLKGQLRRLRKPSPGSNATVRAGSRPPLQGL